MSDNWVHIISTSPEFVPADDDVVRRALDIVRTTAPRSDEIETALTDRPEFFDCGSNWSGVKCPRCHADLEGAWGDWMSAADETGKLQVVATCCGAQLSLDELDFGWPCGFARFAISARNPDLAEFPRAKLRELGRLLGTDLRIIWQHL
jgi:hypothetical protein